MTATGRVVVVTGASSGIGRATAIQLSRSGSVVVLASRSESALLAAQQDCAPGMTTVVPTDVSRRHEVDALMDEAIRVHGRVDAVVHGMVLGRPALARCIRVGNDSLLATCRRLTTTPAWRQPA